MWRVKVACVALVAWAACGDEPAAAPPPVDLSCDGQPDPHCDHPIDRLLIPRLRALGVPIVSASPEEVCRRLAIDLIGRGPTPDELASCRLYAPVRMFDVFADRLDYLREQRRTWAELFEYDIKQISSTEIFDLDRLVGQAYAGTIDYAELATRVAMHPAFYGLHPGDAWAMQLWSIFLGRSARADEIEAMRPLTRAWATREVCDGAVWWNFYRAARSRGAFEAQAVLEGDQACWNVPKTEWGMNLCGCRPSGFGGGCAGDALGLRVELTAACPDPTDESAPANFVRASDRPFGNTKCPDGTVRPECLPRLVDRSTPNAFLPFAQWGAPPQRTLTEARGVGAALAARGDFWEAAVDRELRKLLGWWQTTFRHPDSDLPEIRALLTAQLRATGSLRELQRTIATSLLYTMPGAAPAVDGVADMPPWVAGPTKLLAGEPWLATAAAAVGAQAGRCDFRWVSAGQYTPFWADARLVEPPDTAGLDSITRPGYSIDALLRLGACTSETRRPALSNIGLTFAEADIAHVLCAYGPRVVPMDMHIDFGAAATALIERIWHRTADPAELPQMVADMNACSVAPLTTGCASPEVTVRWMCQRMIDSAEFATY